MVDKKLCETCVKYPASIKKCYHDGYCKNFVYAEGENPARLKNLYEPAKNADGNANG